MGINHSVVYAIYINTALLPLPGVIHRALFRDTLSPYRTVLIKFIDLNKVREDESGPPSCSGNFLFFHNNRYIYCVHCYVLRSNPNELVQESMSGPTSSRFVMPKAWQSNKKD